jgi:biotin operon repressor/predicted GIY-YIG superfamily endonuclease
MEDLAEVKEPGELTDANRQAVYRCFGADGRLLYIGTTGRFGRRLAAHAEKIWFLEVRGITLEWYPDEVSAGAAERLAIHVEQPKYNITHKNARLRPIAARTANAPEPPIAMESIAVRKLTFARALDDAPERGISPRQLADVSGLSRSLVHMLLEELVQSGVIVRVARGYYRVMSGRSAEADIGSRQIS